MLQRYITVNFFNKGVLRKDRSEMFLQYRLPILFFADKETFADIGTNFAKFVSEDAGTELDVTEIIIPVGLMDAIKVMLDEHRKIIQS